MSGIAGIYHRDGAPADRGLVNALTRFLAYVGPDTQNIHVKGPIALGHALLATTNESKNEIQPASLDGKFWIVADARIDARDELLNALTSAGHPAGPDTTDAALILQAYRAWGRDCVHRLLGDFAFAIWDADARTLFCARDRFGIKPFYYAEAGAQFIFSNVLDCIRLHPDVSAELNEAAVADFLLFGLNCDVNATTFREIQRLPPAHTLSISPESIHIERYWSAPIDGRVRYKDTRAYVEHFKELFRLAVSDRMRAGRVGLLMSGGLDSATVAATARDLSVQTGAALHAFTVVYESLFADDEGGYARQLAEALTIPIECIAADSLLPFGGWPQEGEPASNLRNKEVDGHAMAWPEPVDDPFIAGLFVQFRSIAKCCRVALSGDGSDNLMHFEMWPYAKSLVRESDWGTLARQMPPYLRKRRSPLPGAFRRVKRAFGKDDVTPEFPKWLSPEFVERLGLKTRAAQWRELPKNRPHPLLPRGHASLALPQWSNLFEMQSPGVTHCPVEMRHPFLDLRVVNFLLSLPPFPLYMEKKMLREVLIGRVPESVRLRKKTPLSGNPLQQHIRREEATWMSNVKWTKEMESYVDTSKLERILRTESKSSDLKPKLNRIESAVRPICLNFWLQSMRRVRYNLHAEVRNG
jgi:asparagine synthase (glutamine-hydrolysing)